MPTKLQDAKQIEQNLMSPKVENLNKDESREDWSFATKELLDSLPQAWTRGLLYLLVICISVIVPWAMFFKIDETGSARGRLEPQDKTIRLDSSVMGTVAKLYVKEGESVKTGQNLVELESDLVQTEIQQSQKRLEGQQNQLNQLKLMKNQLVIALQTQEQQNQAQQLEKLAQVEQVRQTLGALKKSYNLQKTEQLAQLNQAKQLLDHSQLAYNLMENRMENAKREVARFRDAFNEGIVSEIQLVDREDMAQDRQRLYQQTRSDLEQAKLRLTERESTYERTLRQTESEIEQAQLRIREQQKSYQGLVEAGKLAILRSEENFKNMEAEISRLEADIAQNKSQIEGLRFQLSQRVIKSPVNGTIFDLPISGAGSVVQPAMMVAEIAPENSSLSLKAHMTTQESGSLKTGLPVKLKFDAYPYQDYGVLPGEIISISPTTEEVDTPQGRIAVYSLNIALKKDCIDSGNKCIPLRPGDTASAEVIVRRRRIIDLILDPFKQLQKGGIGL
ncbi:HlyD family secretion protein [Moorena producens PAL-8-15-08-1]|uniref:HlyD family secretion protein n=2 Tax=Moorena TaxID=1155738 RepID=A0A1D8U476_9CYAN|nr:HlyD family secretion protein [Moorena producens PAL-8-15-08-1]